jgi:tetratricopeptide (TPR) repeat protein
LLVGCSGSPEAELRRAVELQEQDRYLESIELLQGVLDRRPDDSEANYRLGMALIRAGKPHLAVWPLERAILQPEYRVTGGLLLTTAFQQTHSFESAIAAATRVLEHAPESLAARVLRAVAYESARHIEEALADARVILAREPRHFQALMVQGRALSELKRLDEAEPALVELRDVSLATDDPAAAPACLFLPHFLLNRRNDVQHVERELLICLEAFPEDAMVLADVTRFYDGRGESEKATQILRQALGGDVKKLGSRAVLAHRLWATGQKEEAVALLRESAETVNSSEAWRTLAHFHLAAGDLERALEASERAMSVASGDDESLRFFHAEILIESGRLEEAEQIATSLGEPAYRDLLRGHLLYERGDLTGGRRALEQGLSLWPNHAGARQVAGQVALGLGDFEAAESHLLEATRATDGAHDAALDLVRLLLARGDPQRALQFARLAANHPAQKAAAHLLAAQASAALGNAEEARAWLKPLLALPEQRSAAIVALAAVERQEKGAQAAIELIEASQLDLEDPEHERVLRVLAETLVAAGRPQQALARADAALARAPDSPSLHDLRGRVLLKLGRTAEARAEFEQALAADPAHPRALEGLAVTLGEAGQIERAVELLERAAQADPSEELYLYRAAQLLRRAGRTDDALARLDDVVRRFPGAAAARNDLAWILAERDTDLTYALQLAEQAVRADSNPDFLDTLGWVRLQRGETSEAIGLFEQALAESPDSALIRYHLGLALAEAGRPERALELLREALHGGLGVEADMARAKIAELEHAPRATP